MPIVTMRWKDEHLPAVFPPSLAELLRSEAGMDVTEVSSASHDLLNGKEVQAYFDFGENGAAEALSEKLKACGMETTIRSDAEIDKSDRLDRFRPWFMPGIIMTIILIGAVVEEPGYGIISLVLAVGGITMFLIIRAYNRKA